MLPKGPRRGNVARGGPRGSVGGGAHRTPSGSFARQSAAPYSRPTASTADSYPPSQLNIRGASSIPTQVLVSNLAQGTSSEDVRQTFLQFGDIIRVKERRTSQEGQGSVAYEVLFEEKPAAVKAVEQLHGALADGRILSVVIETESGIASSTKPVATTNQTTPAAPPTGPRAANGRGASGNAGAVAATREAAANGGRRELLVPAVAARKAGQAAAAALPRGPAGMGRGQVLTGKDRKAIATATAKQLAAAALVTQNVVIPKGPKALLKANSAPSLQARLGGLPLAQRLGGVKEANRGAASDITALDAQKSKKAAKRAKAAGTSATSAQQGALAGSTGKKRKASKAKKSAAGAQATMDLD